MPGGLLSRWQSRWPTGNKAFFFFARRANDIEKGAISARTRRRRKETTDVMPAGTMNELASVKGKNCIFGAGRESWRRE